jgi:Spy/CpxP family protein refolding chaperone
MACSSGLTNTGTRARLLGFLIMLLPISTGQLHAQASVPVDKEWLENGEGAGMASYADANGYPGPKHILDMQDQLNMSEEQLKDIQSIFEAMSESAHAKGDAIVKKEVELEKLFSTRKATEGEVKKLSKEIGALRGELRAVQLAAHIQVKQILTEKQVATYNSIRDRMRQHKKGH